MDDIASHRERKKARTRDAMAEQAMELFLARGVEGGAGPERERLAAPAFPKKSKVTRRNEK